MLSTLNLTVTTLADSNVGSLRDAIIMANADMVDNQVNIGFATGLHGTIDLTTALPDIESNIAINGPGARSLTIQRDQYAGAFTVFTVDMQGPQNGTINTVSISGVTIANGCTGWLGGGVQNAGTLTLANDILTNNAATLNGYGGGGAIDNNGTLTITNDTFSNNTASMYGGGAIFNNWDGTLTVTGSVFSGNAIVNTTNMDPGGLVVNCYDGGAIYDAGGKSTITDSVFSGNSAVTYGGALCSINGVETITACTFTNNSSDTRGNAISDWGTITLTNCTIANNTSASPWGSDGVAAIDNIGGNLVVTNCTVANNGGCGIYGRSSTTVNNTIIANNANRDFSGILSVPSKNNLIRNGTGIENPVLDPSNLVGTTVDPIDPMLGPLQNNGGPTQTMALLSGSPAIGTGSVTLGVDANGNPLQYDQRGAGYPRTLNWTVDIGAYESAQLTPMVNVIDNGGTYNGMVFPAIATVNGQSSLEGVTSTLDYQQFVNGAWKDLGTIAPINAGTYDVTANFAGSANYTAASSNTVYFSIVPANATVRVTALPHLVYNGTPQETASYIATGVNGIILPGGNFTDTTVHTNAGPYTDNWTFIDPTGNYISHSSTVTSTIAQATATIIVTPTLGLIYNGGPQVTATGTATGVRGENLNSDLTVNSTYTNAGTYTDSWTFTDPNGNYGPNSGGMTDKISPATPSFFGLIGSQSITYGTNEILVSGTLSAPPVSPGGESVTVSVDGKNVSTGIASNGSFTLDIPTAEIPVGSYTITYSYAGDSNFNPATDTGTSLTVSAAPLVISANKVNSVYGVPPTLTYTETGLQNGETIGNVVLVTNTTTSGSRNLNAGTWTITPSDATGVTFNPSNYSITYTPGSLTVIPASISGRFTASNKTYDGTTTATVTNSGTNAISGDNVQLTYTGATFASANVGLQPVAITNPGITGSDAGDYTLVSVAPEYATITPAPLTITTNNDSGTYGVPPPPGLNGVSYTGFVDGQTSSVLTTLPTVTTTATSTGPVGSYPIRGTGAVDSNYAISYQPGTYTVTPAALTVTATSESKTYGQTASLAGTENGLVNSDTITSVTETSAGAASTSNVGSYSITISNAVGTGLSNYTVTYVDGTLTVNAAPLTVTATNESMTYGGTVPALTYTYTGLVNGDTSATFSGSLVTTATSSSNVGDYPITQGTLAATGDYTINTFNPGTLSIAKANAIVVVTPYSVVQNGAAHTATGTATGVNGALPSSDLNLTGTTHTNAGTYSDSWTFSDPNYVSQSGTVIDTIVQAHAPATLNQVLVEEYYHVFLNRAAEPEGLTYWSTLLNNGATPNSVAMGIANSTESQTDIVTNDYQNFLNRAPDSGGLASWLGQLQSGRTPDQVAAGILGSVEYFADNGGTNQGFVSALYRNVLGRASDSGGNAVWLNALASGVSRTQVAFGFLTSPEAAAKQVTSADYLGILGRSPDAGGLNNWVEVLTGTNPSQTNQQVAVGFIDSAENINRIDAAIAQMQDATVDQIAMSLLGPPDRDSQGG